MNFHLIVTNNYNECTPYPSEHSKLPMNTAIETNKSSNCQRLAPLHRASSSTDYSHQAWQTIVKRRTLTYLRRKAVINAQHQADCISPKYAEECTTICPGCLDQLQQRPIHITLYYITRNYKLLIQLPRKSWLLSSGHRRIWKILANDPLYCIVANRTARVANIQTIFYLRQATATSDHT